MRKIFTPLITLVLSSFLFLSNVSAVSVTVPQVIENLTEADFTSLQTLMANNNITDYTIFYYWNDTQGRITDKIVYMNPSSISCFNQSGVSASFTNGTAYNISDDYTSLSFKRSYTSWTVTIGGTYPTYTFAVYSTANLSFSEVCSYPYSMTYENNIYTMPTSDDLSFYTIYDIYEVIHADPYPLFTSFFDVVFEKLQLICEFFTSSYIYLSIFVIFILYFCILLLRRLI